MIAALFVETDGAYYGIEDVDPWNEERDARLYAGPHAVVAHPPCARWCKLAGLVEAMGGKKRGEDAGCFASALDAVRRWGGVLEHPASSGAWPVFGLPAPVPGAWVSSLFCEGWATQVSQVAYGHRAQKRTWLYYVGLVPPPLLDWSEPPHTHIVTTTQHPAALPELSKRERRATPPAFRDLLLEMARTAGTKGPDQ